MARAKRLLGFLLILLGACQLGWQVMAFSQAKGLMIWPLAGGLVCVLMGIYLVRGNAGRALLDDDDDDDDDEEDLG